MELKKIFLNQEKNELVLLFVEINRWVKGIIIKN